MKKNLSYFSVVQNFICCSFNSSKCEIHRDSVLEALIQFLILLCVLLLSRKSFYRTSLEYLLLCTVCRRTRKRNLWSSKCSFCIRAMPRVKSTLWLALVFTLSSVPVSTAAPVISTILEGNQPTGGGTIISISGSGFLLYSTVSSLGYTSSGATTWISTTSVLTNAGYGIGGSISMSLLVDNFGSIFITQVATYDQPMISAISAPNMIGSESSSVTISGSSFAWANYSPYDRVGQSDSAATAWIADTSIFCKAPVGSFQSLILVVTLGIQVASLSEIATYETGIGSTVGVRNVGVIAGSSISIGGYSFGNVRCEIKQDKEHQRVHSATISCKFV